MACDGESRAGTLDPLEEWEEMKVNSSALDAFSF